MGRRKYSGNINFIDFHDASHNIYLRSDIQIKIKGADAFLKTDGSRKHVIVREDGHYFGSCFAFDPPDKAPVGMDNKVKKFEDFVISIIS